MSAIANALLLFGGSAVLLVLTLFRTSPAHGCPLGIGIFSLVTFLFLAVISVIEVVSALRIAGSTFYPAVIAVFLLAIVAFCPDTIAFYKLIGLPRTSETEDIAGEVCFVAIEIAVLAFFRNRYRAEVKILPFYPLFAAVAIDIVVYVSLLPFRMNIIAHFFFLIVILVYFIIFQIRIYGADADTTAFVLISAIFFFMRRDAYRQRTLLRRACPLCRGTLVRLPLGLHPLLSLLLSHVPSANGKKSVSSRSL